MVYSRVLLQEWKRTQRGTLSYMQTGNIYASYQSYHKRLHLIVKQLKRIHETQQLWHRSSSTQKSRLTWLLQVMHWKQVLLLLSYHIHVSASKRDADLKEIVTECIGSVGSLRGAAEHRGCTAPEYLLSLCQNFLLQLLKMLMAHRKAELKILLHIYLHWF